MHRKISKKSAITTIGGKMLHSKQEGNSASTKIRAAVAAILAVGLLVSGTSMNAASAAAKPKQIRILYATAEANSAAVQAALPSFKTKTGVQLVMDTMPYGALQTKVFAEFAAKSSYYDVVIVDTPWSPALAQNLEPLSTYMTNASLNDLAPLNPADFIPKVFYDTD
jgi:multiple sugar transport system substrate-binding protein